jgi:Mg-chelatase subunit ChlD
VPLAAAAPAVVAASGSNAADGPVIIKARKAEDGNYDVLVTLQSPDEAVRTPVDICCVVDVSGSMQTEATLKTNSGQAESHGLSLLDVVKHAVKTVVSTLSKADRLSLVSFSDTAKVISDLTYMDDSGKSAVLKKVENLCTEGSTNIWDGLEKGMQTLQKHSQPGRQSCVMLLTDGQVREERKRKEGKKKQKKIPKTETFPSFFSSFSFAISFFSSHSLFFLLFSSSPTLPLLVANSVC